MLGIACDLEKLKYPVYASPKLDGIRAIIENNTLCSRNSKAIPNIYTQELFKDLGNGLDGELIVDSPTAPDAFRKTSSGVMSIQGEPNVTFHIFDNYMLKDKGIIERCINIPVMPNTKKVQQVRIENISMLLNYEETCLGAGYEGIMLRYPDAPYKFGRSTIKEGALLKLKRFFDSEALVLAVEPLYTNLNEAAKDALGRTTRSSHQENKHAQERLGSLLVRDIHTGVEFSVGSGFDDELRNELWNNNPIGKIIKYKYFPVGQKDKPRFPIFLGFRDKQDMS